MTQEIKRFLLEDYMDKKYSDKKFKVKTNQNEEDKSIKFKDLYKGQKTLKEIFDEDEGFWL